ncbi:hypothetical protein [Acinetobacter sp. YH12208]|uniref:hypothetical protein n=1 Tax=Acinetobacter sp. YH12208 TaxID=2601144 RepID=UPI0015D439E7|nr:hypothetical protein [Acinetobacter sp. YH12208]
MTIHKTNSITNYLDNIAPFYYFLIIPFVIALTIICFDFEFRGIFPNTQQLQISSKHKFLNDFFAMCTWITIALIFFSRKFIGLKPEIQLQVQNDVIKQIRTRDGLAMYSATMTFFFIFFIICISLTWFPSDPTLPETGSKGYVLNKALYFAKPGLILFIQYFKYTLSLLFILYFVHILDARKIIKEQSKI